MPPQRNLASFASILFHPEWVDAPPLGHHGDPWWSKLSKPLQVILVADAVGNISRLTKQPAVARLLGKIHSQLLSNASGELTSYEPGDDICPPWPWPHPRPWQWVFGPRPEPWVFGPSPDPWIWNKASATMREVVMAHALRALAGLSPDAKIGAGLKSASETLIRSVAGKLADDFCGTPVPRPRPGPKR